MSKRNLRELEKSPLRVLYKSNSQTPEIKFIKDIFNFKKTIIKHQFEIIPYENVFIICNNKKVMENEIPNIVFNTSKIAGDLIFIRINKDKRIFESLTEEDIIWFTSDLINKNFNYNKNLTTYTAENCIQKRKTFESQIRK